MSHVWGFAGCMTYKNPDLTLALQVLEHHQTY